jgi:hypothetical protein
VADDWQPDLERLCRDLADPASLANTAALMHAQEFGDWWPDPILGDDQVQEFAEEAIEALEALPNRGRGGGGDDTPYADLLGETHYVMLLSPFNAEGEAALAGAITAHLEAIFPPARRRRVRQRLLQMGYLAAENNRPVLARLIMTAAWALDPSSGVDAVDHPFLRQMLHKTVEMDLMITGEDESFDEDAAQEYFELER